MAEALDTDAALMTRVRGGDRDAFEQLVHRYQQPVIRFVARMLRDEAEAEDIAQHTFVQVWKSAHRYQVSARFATWLFTIARNLCLNEIRRRSRHAADSLDAPIGDDEDLPARQLADVASLMPSDLLARDELVQKVDEAIRDLPEAQRAALLLCREEDVSYDEIGNILGTSLSATKSLIFRARETVKSRVKRYLCTGEWPGR
ncbi:MAG: sigma-70 family RNA polymerase sigma factor [Verrucomicrobia bacterium]|nr:sigma-70 family RNA polymerase sigma factor [Verrucomicrobiota bacterium]MBI3870740.1 sigma-70 family RNA polymerase sigma factor [Verrucomicrobiota bacterium]